MDTQTLPREEWGAFFDDVSRQFVQGQVSVTVSGNGMSDSPVISGLPLLGIQLNTKGSDAGTITVIAARDEDASISHTIEAPTQIHVSRTPGGAVDTVQIDASDPAQTRIQLLSSS